MNQEKKQQIIALLRARISDAEARAHFYVFEDGRKRPNRNVYARIKEHLNKFLSGDKSRRWVILTGLRGAGKTTLMSQIFFDIPKEAKKLFLSVDQIDQSVSLREILSIYENDFLGMSFAQFGKPVFLFLDEIQYDKGWGRTLKSIYDNAPNVFIFVTGSSALSMNMNVDVARRPVFEKVFPLSFCEYRKIKERRVEEKDLEKEMREAFLQSQSAQELFLEIKKLEPKINNYLTKIRNKDVNDFIMYASLPSLVGLEESVLAYDQVKNILDRVVGQDILQTEEFNVETLNKIKDILYITANGDKISFSAIGNNTGIQLHYMTVSRIFEILQQTEVLMRVLPFSVSHNTQVRQASKFLFSTPVFRAMYFHLRGSVLSPEEARGKLLEDIVGMYLNRILYQQKEVHLNYDAERGGADFVVGFGNRDIVMEVSTDKKTIKQVVRTMNKIKSTYGIIISEKQEILDINEEYGIVKIPFKYFLLM